ncbi:MAG: hypothetical protein JW955_17965 [Sedimentisphaerales bacterium]|nr:hypothetical protein [Sedimentisphaerales bacterium]
MTNTIDLFVPEYASLALPAGTVAVFVDGALCGDLEPVEIVRAGWPQFSRAVLRATSHLEWTIGSSVSLRQLLNAGPLQTAVGGLSVFEGQIDGIETAMGPDGEAVELVARDASTVLERITVYGQYAGAEGGDTIFLPGLDTVFNLGGRGNAALEPVAIGGRTCLAFCANAGKATTWRLADVIDYLLSAYLPSGQLGRPDIEELLALTQGRLARDLDVTGLSLLEALYRGCEPAGLAFRFVPRLVETGPSQAIVFYRNGRGRSVELSCQPAGQRLNLSRSNVAALHGRRDSCPVTHRHIGRGDFKVYEATFDLVKAWNPALESTGYHAFSPSTNPQFHRVRDVYRKWCLNEAGDYTGEPYNRGQPCDLTRVFEGASYVCRRRRFWPTLSTDSYGRPVGYFLEVSYDDGLTWRQYSYAFNNLLEECGIWLSSDPLDMDTWAAALAGTLRFRVTATIVSDERLTCIVADGPVGSTVPVIDHVLTLPRRFQYRKVSGYSVLAGMAGFGPPNEIDDTAALYEFVRQRAASSSAIVETADVQTPTLALHFEPGDRVTTGPDSRDLLNCRRDSRSLMWIEQVQMDFANQRTRLRLVRQRVPNE